MLSARGDGGLDGGIEVKIPRRVVVGAFARSSNDDTAALSAGLKPVEPPAYILAFFFSSTIVKA